MVAKTTAVTSASHVDVATVLPSVYDQLMGPPFIILPPVIREVAQMIDGAYGTLIDREMPLSIPN